MPVEQQQNPARAGSCFPEHREQSRGNRAQSCQGRRLRVVTSTRVCCRDPDWRANQRRLNLGSHSLPSHVAHLRAHPVTREQQLPTSPCSRMILSDVGRSRNRHMWLTKSSESTSSGMRRNTDAGRSAKSAIWQSRILAVIQAESAAAPRLRSQRMSQRTRQRGLSLCNVVGNVTNWSARISSFVVTRLDTSSWPSGRKS